MVGGRFTDLQSQLPFNTGQRSRADKYRNIVEFSSAVEGNVEGKKLSVAS